MSITDQYRRSPITTPLSPIPRRCLADTSSVMAIGAGRSSLSYPSKNCEKAVGYSSPTAYGRLVCTETMSPGETIVL